jgi:hypothetical protein
MRRDPVVGGIEAGADGDTLDHDQGIARHIYWAVGDDLEAQPVTRGDAVDFLLHRAGVCIDQDSDSGRRIRHVRRRSLPAKHPHATERVFGARLTHNGVRENLQQKRCLRSRRLQKGRRAALAGRPFHCRAVVRQADRDAWCHAAWTPVKVGIQLTVAGDRGI